MDMRARIEGSVCGFVTVVEARSTDGVLVQLDIESDCAKVQDLAAELSELDAVEEVLRKSFVETAVAQLAAKHKLHTSCVVPVGLIRAVEAAAGLALPRSSVIELTRIE